MTNLFIREYRNQLTPEFCNRVISRFESSGLSSPGKISDSMGNRIVDTNVKQSLDLHLSKYPKEWEYEDVVFFQSLNNCLKDYNEYLSSINICPGVVSYTGNIDKVFSDTGYQIQKTVPGGFYDWHNDFLVDQLGVRYLTYIWYLNSNFEGGNTEFICGTEIVPEIGKLIIFPATWTNYHRGQPVIEGEKYVVAGCIHVKDILSNKNVKIP